MCSWASAGLKEGGSVVLTNQYSPGPCHLKRKRQLKMDHHASSRFCSQSTRVLFR
jgi:hypothetical protein